MAQATAFTVNAPVLSSAAQISGISSCTSFLRLTPLKSSALRGKVAVRASLTEKSVVSEIAQALKDEKNQAAVATTMAGALFATLANVGSASAAEEVLSLAAGDSRGLTLLAVVAPALGWVLYNILRPGLNQLDKMKGAKAFIGAAGLGAAASLVAAPDADAAQQIAELADDSRPLLLLFVLAPAVGWVLFNILKPALNQLNKMKGPKSIVGAAGLGAAGLLVAPHADAAQEIAQLADDSRPLLLLFVLAPAVGWVLFNILKPALNQLNKMKGNGLAATVGLGSAASLLYAPHADAAQEIAQLADDSRPLLLLFVLAPAIGWVLFNILKPALNQLNKMQKK